MSQIVALAASIALGLAVALFFPELRVVRRLLHSPKARVDFGVGLGLLLGLNLGPLMFDGPWLNRSEEEVGWLEILVISSVISGFFFFLSFNAERKARK